MENDSVSPVRVNHMSQDCVTLVWQPEDDTTYHRASQIAPGACVYSPELQPGGLLSLSRLQPKLRSA